MLHCFGHKIFIRTPFYLVQAATRREKENLSDWEGDTAHRTFRCAVSRSEQQQIIFGKPWRLLFLNPINTKALGRFYYLLDDHYQLGTAPNRPQHPPWRSIHHRRISRSVFKCNRSVSVLFLLWILIRLLWLQLYVLLQRLRANTLRC